MDFTRAWQSSRCCTHSGRQHRHLHVASGLKTTAPTGTTDLQSWAQRNGAEAHKIVIGSNQGERGLKAAEPISAGDDIAMVPRSIALVVTDVSKCPCPETVDATFFLKAPRLLKLAITLLHERNLGTASKVQPYIAALPEAVDLPCLWDQKSVERIRNAGLRGRIAAQAAEWHGWHEQLHATSPACPWAEADLQWALACVVSRAFTGPYIGSTIQGRLNLLLAVSGATAVTLTFGLAPESQVISAALASVVFNAIFELLRSRQIKQYTLCPLVDMANHSSSEGAEVEYDYFRDSFFSQAARPYQRGHEVFVSYGSQTADSLLQYYGFVGTAEEGGDVYTLHGMAAALRERAPAERWAEVEAAVARKALPAVNRIALTDKAQVGDEVKAVLRYLLGAAGSLEDAAEKVSNRADVVVWEFVLKAARADQAENGLGGKGEAAALKAARKAGQAREVVARRYNMRKAEFLQARIAQLERRVAKMRQ
eukprot:jgi/Ulvmu1/3054/UM015_0094.1